MTDRLDLDGSGVYNREHILGLEVDPTRICVDDVDVPQIEEIRLIRGADGEDYVNVNDLHSMMRYLVFKLFPSLSSVLLVKRVINELKGE